jgi:hypothetical protein
MRIDVAIAGMLVVLAVLAVLCVVQSSEVERKIEEVARWMRCIS